ncbi:DUF4365 domain-containing protein [Gordonia sihwensis]|uniref:DUF4365 domain-containing protein n=1 Tax=Gordonia sihwensis TaxID=173559 RepID=UPI002415FC63|nr:DUF4365 domain-containing protein [Gordonia sihwensis]WFN93803.1 DUF4365 domain-containing protein [Gordonia sihwensis]
MAEAASIPAADRTGRFGALYVRALLGQAGVIHQETAGGEDHGAIEIMVTFPSGACFIQVKTGTKAPNKDGSLTVPVTDDWKAKWANNVLPAYLVYVHLEKAPPADWVDHEDLQAVVHATALWGRVNQVSGKSVRLPRENRLTADTFALWASEFDDPSAWGKAASA